MTSTTAFHLDRGKGTARAILATIPLTIGLASPACAGTQRTQIVVGVTVQAIATMHTLRAQPALLVTANDVRRGFVEIPAAQELQITTNSREGYVLNLQPLSNVFTHIEVFNASVLADVGAEGASIVQRMQGARDVILSLGYRIYLAPGIRPGAYPWPLRLAVVPL